MKPMVFRWAAIAAELALLAGCTTANQTIETSTSPASGRLAEHLIVLGVASKVTVTGNRSATSGANTGEEFVENTIRIDDVPLGTRVIVPVVTGWDLGYGSLSPEDQLTADLAVSHPPAWNDSHRTQWFGRARVDVSVLNVDAPGPGAATQTARVQVVMRLADDWQDDAWWGAVRYQLIYLGYPPPPR